MYALKSWKEIRDYEVVKQQYDYSCGIASLATLLDNLYGENFTEADLLKELKELKNFKENDKNPEQKYSFLDLKKIANQKGYKASGLALDFDNLKKLKIPVIVYIKPKGVDHFSVLKKIDGENVYLADPTWGNSKIRQEKFIEIWKTRDSSNYYGKVLIITKE